MSSRAGPSSSSVWCNLGQIVMLAGRWGSIGAGDPEAIASNSLSIARSEKTLFIFGLTYCEGP